MCNGFFDIFRIHQTAITQSDTQLFFVESHVFGVGDMLFVFRIYIQQPIHAASLDDMFIDDFLCIIRFHFHIESIVRQYINDRSFFTEAETAGANYLNIFNQSFGSQLSFQIIENGFTV